MRQDFGSLPYFRGFAGADASPPPFAFVLLTGFCAETGITNVATAPRRKAASNTRTLCEVIFEHVYSPIS